MWEKVKFIVSNLKSITMAGVVFWAIVVLTLQLAGLIDIEARCPSCARYFDKAFTAILSDASAASKDVVRFETSAPLTVTVTFLPQHRPAST